MTKNPGKLTCEPIIPTNSSNTNSNNNPEAKEAISGPQKEFSTPQEKIEHLENQVKKLVGELKAKKF
jgi:archaellum component FlaC